RAEVAPLHRVLHADITRAGLAVDEGRALPDIQARERGQRQALAARRRDQQPADRVGVIAVALVHAHHEVEIALSLDDLRRRHAAHRRLEEAINGRDVEPIERELLAVDLHVEAGLTELAYDRDVLDTSHLADRALHALRELLELVQIRAIDLHGEGAL